MDHAYAQEHDLYEAYLAGRLTEEDREAFEAHYFDCDECLRQLELATDFREGMQDGAAEAVTAAGTGARTQSAEASRLGLLAALALALRGRRLRALGLGGGFLLLLALPALLLWRAGGRGGESRLVPPAAERRIAELESRLRGLEASAGAERAKLETELARERQARADAEAEAGSGTRIAQSGTSLPIPGQPQVNVPLYTLAAVRGGDEGREPVNRLALPAGGGSIVVTLELASVDHPAYRVRLRDARGREVWQAGGLRPDGRDTLVLLLPSSLLPPGTYDLTLEGERPGASPVTVGAYPFRVVQQPPP